jgi:hypothetical protein
MRLARWLQEKGYATTEQAESVVAEETRATRDLPKAEPLANLLYDFAR